MERLNLFKIDKETDVYNFLLESYYKTVESLQKKWLFLSDEEKKGWYISKDKGKTYSLIDDKSSPDDVSRATVNLFSLKENTHLIQKSSKVILESDYLKKVWNDLEYHETQDWFTSDGDVKIDSSSKEFVDKDTILEDELVIHPSLVSPIKASVLLALWDDLSDENKSEWIVLYTGGKIIEETREI